MKFAVLIILILSILIACEKQAPIPEAVLNQYIKAANEHNIDKVKEMYADSIIWYFGPYTFEGKEEALAPLKFDKGANTMLIVSDVIINGDTVDFNLLETSDVITALGIRQLHHFPRFIIKDGLITIKLSRKPPMEISAFSDSVKSFATWLSENKPEKFEQFWPEGKFNFSEETGRDMPWEVKKWRERI
jgi:hypothetical protein